LFLNANQEMNASQSLERGLKIFELLDGSTTSLGVREIAHRLDLSTTIAQRLVNTLATYSYLEQISETRRYRIGPRAVGLGSSVIAALSVAFLRPRLQKMTCTRCPGSCWIPPQSCLAALVVAPLF
jgi:DNA-binding IclR family transcriptional regulator